MGVLNNGMSLNSLSIDWQQAIKGLVLLAAVAFDVWDKKRTAGGGGAGAEAEAPTAPPPDELVDALDDGSPPPGGASAAAGAPAGVLRQLGRRGGNNG